MAFVALRAWDGLHGALVNDNIFITSPNCTGLYSPPLGVNREMWMREDFRYGVDDPLSWPQPYCRTRPHLACMRLCPRDDSDPDVPLFELLLQEDFEELDLSLLIHGPGFWRRERRCVFQQRCWAILSGCEGIPHVDEAAKAGANRADELLGYARMFLECLDGLPLTFHRLCLCVAETQQLILEAEAIKFFFGTICPSSLAPVSEHVPKADADLVSCVTTDIGVAQQFHRAGVPVWLLRALNTLPHTHIDAVGRLKTAEGHLRMGPCPLRLPSVYVGGAGDEEKYLAFNRFTRSHLGAPNLLLWSPGELRSEASWVPEHGSVQLSPAREVCLPYNHASHSHKGNLKPQKPNSFALITHELLPDICLAWKVGLSSVDANKERINVPAAPFAFPRADLFATIADGTKWMSALSTWLRLRPGLLAMQTPSYTSTRMSHQMWRAILTYDWVGQSNVRDRIRGKITDRRELALKFLEGCLGEMSVEAHGISVEGKWRGTPIRDVSREDCPLRYTGS
ncbi:uncharacterized protein EV420DRAFT_1652949 [Desarmillaria tabescens]|uniref:Uncharacterized protein n=1 Tax=Armillaria tabescens TaxID=1929756 RepID=A0AA39J537_ARMTA|nr:uncharacterized protein EV420DRAFT_1652949 [Desarmillaria tabescens]KAK0435809.1 hypothetical protein EV420DRAFT_1652949 [Desarmillaria tabescens]